MTEKVLTKEEIALLSENPYVRSVSPTTITYTDDFRKEFVRLHEEGLTYREIFTELGFDAEVVGSSRIAYMGRNILRRKKSGSSLEDRRKYNSGKKGQSETATECRRARQEIKFLNHCVRYLEAVCKLLKKSSYFAGQRRMKRML